LRCFFFVRTGLSFSFLLLLAFSFAFQSPAQTFKTLHSFNASDGAHPSARLVLSSNTLYGTTSSGGEFDSGTVFSVNSDGTGLKTLHHFTDRQWPYYTNSDGAFPAAGLILSGNTLYGTARDGGSYNGGTIFSVHTDGTGFATLHNFATTSNTSNTNSNGAFPVAALILSDDTLYGTSENGSSSNDVGTLFALKTDGTGFTVLHEFIATNRDSSGVYTNADGAFPYAGLVLASNTLYGTAPFGGGFGNGTIFSVHTDGTAFTTLHTFTKISLPSYTNSDGARPAAELVISDNTLYGTAPFGGSFGNGTVFSVHTDGSGFRALHNFTTTSSPSYTNSDGANPQSELIISGNTMFGSAQQGGRSGYGSVFAMNIDGTHFITLHDFTAPSIGLPATNSDGFYPSSGLVLSGSVLYGTATYGGSPSGNGDANGTIFSISLPVSTPQLTVYPSGSNLILSWETNHAGVDFSGYILQSTTNLAPPVWITNLPAPVIVNGQYTVTNPISGTQQFFRLSQ
jgi:uncharacterized repeat protein (TIGR03803 family)